MKRKINPAWKKAKGEFIFWFDKDALKKLEPFFPLSGVLNVPPLKVMKFEGKTGKFIELKSLKKPQ